MDMCGPERRLFEDSNRLFVAKAVKWEKQHARKLRGIYHTDPDDGVKKETIENARKFRSFDGGGHALRYWRQESAEKKLRETASETTESNKKTNHACIVEAHESTRKRVETTLPKDHEDHIAESGFDSMSH